MMATFGRARGLSLLELLFAMGLLVVLSVAVGQAASTAFRWRRAAQAIASDEARAAELRATIRALASEGELVERVALDAAGRPRATRVLAPSATWRTGPATLVVRTPSGFRILERCGPDLLLRRIANDGHATSERLASDVTSARFARAAGGLEWSLVFQSREAGAVARPSSGFAAFRLDGGAP